MKKRVLICLFVILILFISGCTQKKFVSVKNDSSVNVETGFVQMLNVEDDYNPVDIVGLLRGELYIGGEKGLFKLEKNKWKRIMLLDDRNYKVTSQFLEYNDELYFGVYSNESAGIYKVSKDNDIKRVIDVQQKEAIKDLIVYSGEIYGIDSNSVFKVQGENLIRIGNLSGKRLVSIIEYDKNLYVGTFSKGVLRFKENNWEEVGELINEPNEPEILGFTVEHLEEFDGELFASGQLTLNEPSDIMFIVAPPGGHPLKKKCVIFKLKENIWTEIKGACAIQFVNYKNNLFVFGSRTVYKLVNDKFVKVDEMKYESFRISTYKTNNDEIYVSNGREIFKYKPSS